MNMILDNKLRNKEVIVLDGAIGSEIARLGAVMNSSAWHRHIIFPESN